MSFLALVAALGLEQWRVFSWRASVERAFVRYARWIERKWNGGTAQHGWLALVAEPQKRAVVAPTQKYPDDKVNPASVRKGIDILASDISTRR